MKLAARKICNSCRETVAVKKLIGYRSVKDYVTISLHEEPCYSSDNGKKVPLHYCSNCWTGFQTAINNSQSLEG